MKKLYFLNETEKERILNLYENKGNNKNILNEEEKATRTTGFLFVSGYDVDTAFCLGNHQPNMVAKGNYGSAIATDGQFLYYKNMKYSTQADYEKWFNGEIEGDMPPISGTYVCTKRSLGGETKRTLKRTETPKAAAQPATEPAAQPAVDAANWPKEYSCVPGAIMKSDKQPGKFYKETKPNSDDEGNNIVYYNTGVATYYDSTGKVKYPKEKEDSPDPKKTFHPFTCIGNIAQLDTSKIVDIDGKPIGGTSVTTNPAANQGYYTNKLANVGQKLGVQTSGQLTPDMLNKLMDKLGGTGSTPKEPTSITI